jgi:phage terminase large subunit GpA-like protein
MSTLDTVRANSLRSLVPPRRFALSEWIEANIVLPEGSSALPGPIRLYRYQREIADAISDPAVERVTLVKAVRVGFTTLLTAAIANYVANDPSPILALLPTESDCRDYVVSEVEPLFATSPVLRGTLGSDCEEGQSTTLLSKRFPGGSLKIVAGKAPRNLRRHMARRGRRHGKRRRGKPDKALRRAPSRSVWTESPQQVLAISGGVDCQDDRLEVTLAGWTRTNECFVLGHVVLWGSPDDDTTGLSSTNY